MIHEPDDGELSLHPRNFPELLVGPSLIARTAGIKGVASGVWYHLVERIEENPDDASALLDLSYALMARGAGEDGLHFQKEAIARRRHFRIVHGDGSGMRILAFVTAGDETANMPIDFLLHGSNCTLWLTYVDAETPHLSDLPPHDVAVVAVAGTEANLVVLARLEVLLCGWKAPVLNKEIAPRGYSRLKPDVGSLPGIASAIGNCWEWLLDLDTDRGDEFDPTRCTDFRGADGLFAKYRVLFVDGKPLPLEMALSNTWRVQFESETAGTEAYLRLREAAWVSTFQNEFAVRHADALRCLSENVGLDYFGIECAEVHDGRLLVFLISNAMPVHYIDSAQEPSTRGLCARKIATAFLTMAADRANTALKRVS